MSVVSGEVTIYEVADDGTMVPRGSFPLEIPDEDTEFDAWWHQIWHPPVWTIRKSGKASHKNRRKRHGG